MCISVQQFFGEGKKERQNKDRQNKARQLESTAKSHWQALTIFPQLTKPICQWRRLKDYVPCDDWSLVKAEEKVCGVGFFKDFKRN